MVAGDVRQSITALDMWWYFFVDEVKKKEKEKIKKPHNAICHITVKTSNFQSTESKTSTIPKTFQSF